MLKLLGNDLYNKILLHTSFELVTEIRLRAEKSAIIKTNRQCFDIGFFINKSFIRTIIDTATSYSLYAYEEEMRQGYIFYKGGIRIGIGGQGVLKNNIFSAFKEITSLCIRIPHEIIGCSDVVKGLLCPFENTLVLAPPGCGKTTLIRDMARVLGNDYDILILDERYEFYGDNSQLDIGKKTDVIQGIPKHLCFEGGIRSLSPNIIICDEIFGEADFDAMEKIVRSGVKILASIHGDSIETIKKFCGKLHLYFNNFILLSSNPKVGSIKSIIRINK